MVPLEQTLNTSVVDDVRAYCINTVVLTSVNELFYPPDYHFLSLPCFMCMSFPVMVHSLGWWNCTSWAAVMRYISMTERRTHRHWLPKQTLEPFRVLVCPDWVLMAPFGKLSFRMTHSDSHKHKPTVRKLPLLSLSLSL